MRPGLGELRQDGGDWNQTNRTLYIRRHEHLRYCTAQVIYFACVSGRLPTQGRGKQKPKRNADWMGELATFDQSNRSRLGSPESGMDLRISREWVWAVICADGCLYFFASRLGEGGPVEWGVGTRRKGSTRTGAGRRSSSNEPEGKYIILLFSKSPSFEVRSCITRPILCTVERGWRSEWRCFPSCLEKHTPHSRSCSPTLANNLNHFSSICNSFPLTVPF